MPESTGMPERAVKALELIATTLQVLTWAVVVGGSIGVVYLLWWWSKLAKVMP